MKKNIILLGALLISGVAFSQVGIDTDQPKATLDVRAKPLDNTKTDGFIAPRVSGNQLKAKDNLYGTDQTGAIVYATAAASPTTDKTVNVTEAGYFYFDGTIWQKFAFDVGNPVIPKEPWYNVATNAPADDNGQNIYQMGKVGVGTKNPISRLHLGGENTPTLTIRGEGTGNTDDYPQGSISFLESGSTNWGMNINFVSPSLSNSVTRNSIRFQNNNGGTLSDVLTIEALGNVGIGETKPTNKLHVVATSDPVKLEGLQNAVAYDKIIVTGTDGVLKTIAANTLPNSTYQEPWLNQTNGSPATANTQSIYQKGKVAVNKDADFISGADLDVKGAIRGGNASVSTSVGENSIAVGNNSVASAGHTIALGNTASATSADAIALGKESKATKSGAFAIGNKVISSGDQSGAFNSETTASGNQANAFGFQSTASGNFSIAGGYKVQAIGQKSSAFGNETEAHGTQSISLGSGSKAFASNSIAGGYETETKSTANNSVALGQGSSTEGTNSFAMGVRSKAIGNQSFAFGEGAITNGTTSVAMGYNVTAGSDAAAFGNGTTASGQGSLASGIGGTTASGSGSFAGGNGAKATGTNSIALGHVVEANSENTAAFGLGSKANGKYSIVAGYESIATNESESVFGQYNKEISGSIFQIGNGIPGSRGSLIVGIKGGVSKDGWVAIGSATTNPSRVGSEKLRVYGSIQTAGDSYPDYVFEDYFTGNSTLNTDYKFKSIYDTEKFIRENKHLPGVTSINELEKTENGYSFNLTELSTQTLEKVEELYLHTIEQQKQIDELKELVKIQQEQINNLIK